MMLNQNIMDSKIFSFLLMAIFVILFVTISVANAETDKCNTTFSTENDLEYHFCPVRTGQIQFRIKAPHNAFIALTTGPQEGEPMYEIIIGGWENTKSVVHKNKTNLDMPEVNTPGILNDGEHRGFWIRWNDGLLEVGKEGKSSPFLSYVDPEPFGIGYFGVCTAWGANGEWLIEGRNSLRTPNKLEYKFYSIQRGSVLIEVKAKSNAHIALTNRKSESSPMYEIILGGWANTASAIRYDRKHPDKAVVNTRDLLTERKFQSFSITWLQGLITVRSGDENGAILMEWRDQNPIGVSYVGVRTCWGATGNWRLHFENYPTISTSQQVLDPTTPLLLMENGEFNMGTMYWCNASGNAMFLQIVDGRIHKKTVYVGSTCDDILDDAEYEDLDDNEKYL